MKKFLTVIALLTTTGLSTIAQTINNPLMGTRSDESTIIKKIETNNLYTIVSFETTAASDNAWVQVNKEIYLQTDVSNAHYDYIKSENIAVAPAKQTIYNAGDKLIFKVYFKKIPAAAKYVNIIERAGSGNGKVSYFNYYNVSLTRSNSSHFSVNTQNSLSEIKIDTANVNLEPPASITVKKTSPGYNDFTTAMSAVQPMMTKMAKAVMDAQLDYYKQPGKITEIAKLNKEYYDALRKEGFSSDDAMKIITADSILPKPAAMNNK